MTTTVGIIGGGQLARMTHQAAIALGVQVVALDEDPGAPAVVAGAAVSAPLWRAFARRLIAAMPPLESVIRGGVAYTVTRGVAAVARRVVSGGQNLAREES